MTININHQLREQMPHDPTNFPISLFCDELSLLPNKEGPLHWHPEFEIATAKCETLDFQVGQEHITLEAGDSIFVNGNILHGVKQISDGTPDTMPNIVFSGTILAPETSVIYQKYINPIIYCDSLSYIVFRKTDEEHAMIHVLINDIYQALQEQQNGYEMVVQRKLSLILENIFFNLDNFPKLESTRIQINTQIRIQKMLSYIYEHYKENITLEDIAKAADISRSEAGRCFKRYMNCSPIDALIQYRLQIAHRLLNETTLSLKEISDSCGFHSTNYFSRRFHKEYGYAPSSFKIMGK